MERATDLAKQLRFDYVHRAGQVDISTVVDHPMIWYLSDFFATTPVYFVVGAAMLSASIAMSLKTALAQD